MRADRIIGADGRARSARRARRPRKASISRTSRGLELVDAPLPFEGLGHVFLGGPGPALLYRIDAAARAGVPGHTHPRRELEMRERKPFILHAAFRDVLPPQLEPALRAATQKPLAWAATGVRSRTFYGQRNVWLIGDAVGHVHPFL